MALPGTRGPKPETIEATEIRPDVWMIGGYLSDDFFLRPPSSNTYLLRDDDVLTIVDPGTYGVYRDKILDFVARYRREGVTRVRMLVTQGHFDHSTNSDLLPRTGLPWEFLLPDVEVATMNAVTDFLTDLDRLGRYEDVFRTMFAHTPVAPLVSGLARINPALARAVLRTTIKGTMGSGDHFASSATLLRSDEKVTRTYGSVTVSGWQVGRLFLIHDGSHSPGHICVYDEPNELILTGDATIEINPAFLYSSMNKLVDITGALTTMVHEGAIRYVADGHRSARYFPRLVESCHAEVLDPVQLADFATGPEECEAFLSFFNRYYAELIREVHDAHRRAGRATVGDIVEELRRSTGPCARFKTAMKFTRVPSRNDVLVAGVLAEAGAVPKHVDDRIVFDPVSA